MQQKVGKYIDCILDMPVHFTSPLVSRVNHESDTYNCILRFEYKMSLTDNHLVIIPPPHSITYFATEDRVKDIFKSLSTKLNQDVCHTFY